MQIRSGLQVLLESRLDLLRGSRVGVIAHPASVNHRLRHIVSLLFENSSVNLTTIMGAQHGARGETQDNMIEWQGYRDQQTGLPVYSLYGEFRKPTREMLQDLDILLFDLQDVGARYYTFIHTMVLAMSACKEMDKSFVVLDRPNPIGGEIVEGPVLDPRFKSFVGLFPLAIRHGMTVGEIALYCNELLQIGCDLTVVSMEGWEREMYFEETGLPWIFPSPNIPRIETAIVYPGMCLLEGTNVSEGRGTTLPFELSGAPWISPDQLFSRLEGFDLPGASFRPLHFQPTFHKWQDDLVGGVQILVEDRNKFKPFRTGLALTMLYRDLGREEFRWKNPPYEYEDRLLPFDILCGTDSVRTQIEAGIPLPEIEASWTAGLVDFLEVRKRFLLY